MYLNQTHYLPVSGKTIYYKSNGTGRDSYIMRDSGGLIKARTVETSHDPGSFYVRGFSSPKSTVSRVEGKTVYYRSNGTGRDSYIAINSGGFTQGGERPDFIKSLRCHPKLRPVTPLKDSNFYSSVSWTSKTPKEMHESNMKNKIIRNMVLRLSTPKQPNQEWKNMMMAPRTPGKKHVRCQSVMGSRDLKGEAQSSWKSTNEISRNDSSISPVSPVIAAASNHKRTSSLDRYARV